MELYYTEFLKKMFKGQIPKRKVTAASKLSYLGLTSTVQIILLKGNMQDYVWLL